MFGKIVLILGIIGVVLGILATGICAALPIATDGRASWEEVAIPLIIAIVFLVFSFFIFLIGLVIMIMNRKKKV